MVTPAKVFDVICHLVKPLYFMLLGTSYLPRTIISLLANFQLRAFISPSAFKDAWFAQFWRYFGPVARERAAPKVIPLLAQAYGTIIDVGPGSGEWVSHFDREKVVKIYGVEPNKDHHPLLRERIKAAGLEDKYVIVPVGVEDLGTKWVEKESVDAVVTIQCLCSVPRPKEMIVSLYGYIKEGGCWILYEHVKAKPGSGVVWYQSMLNIVWPHVFAGCSMTRDTERWLKQAGSWSKLDLKKLEDQPDYERRSSNLAILPSTRPSRIATPPIHYSGVRCLSPTISGGDIPILATAPTSKAMAQSHTLPDAEATPPQDQYTTTLATPSINNSIDDSEEWDYEYSTTETDTYYVTLDLTVPELPKKRLPKPGASTKARWLNPSLGRHKRHGLGAAPTYKPKDASTAQDIEASSQVDVEVEAEDEDEGGEFPPLDDMTGGDAMPQNPEAKRNTQEIQIMDLHTDNPLVSYEGRIFSCKWAENIGTELLFTKRDEQNPLPSIRTLPGNVDLLAASSARLISRPLRVEHKSKRADAELKHRLERPSDFSINVGVRAGPKRRDQARFLESLIDIKESKGEDDLVTVFSHRKRSTEVWRKQLRQEREEERKGLYKTLREGDKPQLVEARKRLAEMDHEDERLKAKEVQNTDGKRKRGQAKRRGATSTMTASGRPVRQGRKKKTGLGFFEEHAQQGGGGSSAQETNPKTVFSPPQGGFGGNHEDVVEEMDGVAEAIYEDEEIYEEFSGDEMEDDDA
ncbi:uncharacterized protein BP5553_05063 [Venustampulla echinocandica]|uniref:Transcription factor TFIIIC triple barrel domain-containing protein n=1 Tax=Venustampulla echinocandica TaxID=2656787 RepID=A0A370TQ39_9HELO|nr:uncharacterized protein BP5553_05063 [Venustampulla echinocandica]RDL37630.1 hypothetical protein BP5553_05063 [Venustampulla echinocandica]